MQTYFSIEKVLKIKRSTKGGSPTLLLIQLFALKVTYKPDPSHQSPGKVANAKGGELALSSDTLFGWAVVPVMER